MRSSGGWSRQNIGFVIPFAGVLAEKIPPLATRLMRDFPQILSLIKAHAILHQSNRDLDSEGRIIAEIGDYTEVFKLVLDIVGQGVEGQVPANVRKTVGVVAKLSEFLTSVEDEEKGVTVRQIATKLGLDRSSAWRRAKQAVDLGYLVNLARPGRPFVIKLGDELPEDVQVLPSPEELELACCAVAGESEGLAVPSSQEGSEQAGEQLMT